jgi:hypothetical protein
MKKCKKGGKCGKKACPVCRVFLTLLKILLAVTGVLFIVYFWNLDQKLLGWAYNSVNKVFDRKPTDIKF